MSYTRGMEKGRGDRRGRSERKRERRALLRYCESMSTPRAVTAVVSAVGRGPGRVLTCSTAPLLQSRASPERNANLRRGFITYTNGIERYVSKVRDTNPNWLRVPYWTGLAMMAVPTPLAPDTAGECGKKKGFW